MHYIYKYMHMYMCVYVYVYSHLYKKLMYATAIEMKALLIGICNSFEIIRP